MAEACDRPVFVPAEHKPGLSLLTVLSACKAVTLHSLVEALTSMDKYT